MPSSVRRVVDRADIAADLLSDGGVLVRHAFRMALMLERAGVDAPLATGLRREPMVAERSDEYGTVMTRSYPSDHPDHQPDDADPASAADEVRRILAGDDVGPWIEAASWHVVDERDRIVGAIIVSEIEFDAVTTAGPWITDIFVDPLQTRRGVGASLIAGAASALVDRGDRQLGLAVSSSNPARRLYERLGFETRHEIWDIRVGRPEVDV